MKKAYLIVVFGVLILISLVILAFVMKGSTNNQPMESAENTKIKNLVNESLKMQYQGGSKDISKLYTSNFLKTITSDTKFYKTNLRPYRIVDKSYINSLIKVYENEYKLSVAIEDKKGRYIQVIHIIKQNGNYLISNIEYDI